MQNVDIVLKSQEIEIFKISEELFRSERFSLINIQHQGCSLKRRVFPVYNYSGPLNILLGLCPVVYEGEIFFLVS